MNELNDLIDRFRNQDRQALARLLTLAARGGHAHTIRSAIRQPHSKTPQGRLVAITGSGGVGKSSLIGRLIEKIRESGQTVAVLACDPESPLTGGALLGDRIRMSGRSGDPGLFIRSLAAAGGHQAVAEHLDLMAEILLAFGFDDVLIETVGAGQGDTAGRRLADVLVVLLQPESGDDLQWEKAGLLEVADVVVVNKADLPGADRVEAQLRHELGLSGSQGPAVVKVSAARDEGIDELWTAIESQPSRRSSHDDDAQRLLETVRQVLAERFNQNPETITPIVERWKRGELDDAEAVDELLRLLL